MLMLNITVNTLGYSLLHIIFTIDSVFKVLYAVHKC